MILLGFLLLVLYLFFRHPALYILGGALIVFGIVLVLLNAAVTPFG